MLPPFAPKKLTAYKTYRDDNEELLELELEATEQITAALSAQLAELNRKSDAIGGGTVGELVNSMMAVIEDGNDALYDMLLPFVTAGALLGVDDAGRSFPLKSFKQEILIPLEGLAAGFSWDLAAAEAAEWARAYTFDLITGLNSTTEIGLRKAVLSWIDSGGTIDDLADSIRPMFADDAATIRIEALFNVDRARMIAETEATRFYAQGKVVAYMSNGLADFPPERTPPDGSHVRCRCDVSLVEYPDGSWHWVWFTVRDSGVSPICAPLHEQSVGLAKAAVPVEA